MHIKALSKHYQEITVKAGWWNKNCPINSVMAFGWKMLSSFQWTGQFTHLSTGDTCSMVSLSRLLIIRSYSEANILESHIKVITSVEKPIGINYSKNLPDGEQYFHVGWQKMWVFNKGLIETIRECVLGSSWTFYKPDSTPSAAMRSLNHHQQRAGSRTFFTKQRAGQATHLPRSQTDTAWETVKDLNHKGPTSFPLSKARKPGKGKEGLLLTGAWVSVWEGSRDGWWRWLHNNMNVLNATKL